VNILGEQAKWVPISPQRVTNIQQNASSMTMTINGSLNEIVTIGFSINYKYQSVQCAFNLNKTQMKIQLTVSPSVQLTCF
jgi:hypothetical protein